MQIPIWKSGQDPSGKSFLAGSHRIYFYATDYWSPDKMRIKLGEPYKVPFTEITITLNTYAQDEIGHYFDAVIETNPAWTVIIVAAAIIAVAGVVFVFRIDRIVDVPWAFILIGIVLIVGIGTITKTYRTVRGGA